jgi:hypothetical protein
MAKGAKTVAEAFKQRFGRRGLYGRCLRFRQRFFYFWKPIKITVAKVHQKATALVLALGNGLHTNNA